MNTPLITYNQSDSSTAAAVESAMQRIEESVPSDLLQVFCPELLPQGIQDLLYATDENQDIPHALKTFFMNPESRQTVILLLRTSGHGDLAKILASKQSETLDDITAKAIVDALSDCTSEKGITGALSQLKKTCATAKSGRTTGETVKELRATVQAVFGNTTVRNEQAHAGRNQTCPCGSGKKYKKCCGGRK